MSETLTQPLFERLPHQYHLSEDEYQDAIVDLGTTLIKEQEVDVIVGSPRGSLRIMLDIAQMLQVHGSKVLQHSINFYNLDGSVNRDSNGHPISTSNTEVIQEVTPEMVKDQRVLFVDDLSHKGWTDHTAKTDLREKGAASVTSCVLFYNEGDNETQIPPDYYWEKTDKWIVFPWELLEAFGARMKTLLDRDATQREIDDLVISYKKESQQQSLTKFIG